MALSLILELKSNSNVLVTNSETKEQREVTLDFVQKITNSSLPILCQYKYYELITNTQRCWSRIKHFDLQIESEITKQIDLKYEEIKNKRESHTIQKDREEDNISKFTLQLQNSYNNMSTALQYADYCLKHDYRYNSKEENIKPNVTIQVAQKDGLKEEQNNYNVLSMIMKEQEQKIIALQKENQALRERITELTTEYINSKIDIVDIIYE